MRRPFWLILILIASLNRSLFDTRLDSCLVVPFFLLLLNPVLVANFQRSYSLLSKAGDVKNKVAGGTAMRNESTRPER